MLLYPDMRRESYGANDDFVFAAPCTETEWETLNAAALTARPESSDYLPYTFIKESYHDEAPADVTYIILMSPQTPDDDAIATAAWIRVVEEYTGIIYALTFESEYNSNQSLSSIIARTAGVPPKQVRHIELPTKRI